MKLIIGNKAYSSWSLRGWLAAKQSGLHFDEIITTYSQVQRVSLTCKKPTLGVFFR
jgi:hypothetical protein